MQASHPASLTRARSRRAPVTWQPGQACRGGLPQQKHSTCSCRTGILTQPLLQGMDSQHLLTCLPDEGSHRVTRRPHLQSNCRAVDAAVVLLHGGGVEHQHRTVSGRGGLQHAMRASKQPPLGGSDSGNADPFVHWMLGSRVQMPSSHKQAPGCSHAHGKPSLDEPQQLSQARAWCPDALTSRSSSGWKAICVRKLLGAWPQQMMLRLSANLPGTCLQHPPLSLVLALLPQAGSVCQWR